MTNKRFSVILGAGFWLCLLGFGFWFFQGTGLESADASAANDSAGSGSEETITRQARNPTSQLLAYWMKRNSEVELTLPEVPAKDGDPIFVLVNGAWQEAGYLNYTDSHQSARKAVAVWHYEGLRPEHCQFEYHRNRGKFADIVRLLLPPEKRERVESIIRESIKTDGKEIAEAMRPILTRSMQQSMPVVEKAFRQSIANHRDELETIGERYRETVLEERLVPLLRDEVLPIVKDHAEPLAQQIGQELWDRASMWRFGWRFLYDRTPLPDRDLVKREWDRFVKEEAIPVLESHTGDMLEVQKNIFRDISQNDQVRDELSAVATEIAKDKELQAIVTMILRESIVDNKELRRVWLDNWQSEEAKAAFRLAGDRLEPVVREIGDELFGTRESGISPSFARVLRNQILGKDKRWLVALPNAELQTSQDLAAGPITVALGNNNMSFPLIIMAGSDELLTE